MTDKKEDENDVLLDEYEVWNTLDFAKEVLGLNGALSIGMLNAGLKSISTVNTGDVTETQVTDALKIPKESEAELQRISEAFNITSPLYKRLLSYLGNIPSFDYTYICKNGTEKDYKAKDVRSAYKKDLAILKNFMGSFNHKQEFGKVMKQLFKNEAHFSVFRDEGEKFVLQELPREYSKITGKFDYGLLMSFDYNWFSNAGINIEFYPPIFKKTLLEQKNQGTYRPSNKISTRGRSNFSNWADCSPKDGFWVFKLSPEIASVIPYFVGMFPDIVQESTIRSLQKSSYMAAAAKIIAGKVPFLQGKTKVKDAISITPELLGKFLGLVQSAINNDAVKVAASPLEDMRGIEFKTEKDIRSSWLRATLGASGAATNLLFSDDVKPNTVETMLSLAVDEILSTSVYPQFADFVNWHVNKLTKKFKFEVTFEGSKFYPDKERRMGVANDLATLGIVLPQKFAAAAGMSPFEMEGQMEMARAEGWVDKLTPIVLAPQLAKEDAGAPKKKDGDLTESGQGTRGDGGNEAIKK